MDGDEAAFAEFVTREWSRLVRVGYLLTGDVGRAEDLVQQALVKVHRHWSRVHHGGSPYAYTLAAAGQWRSLARAACSSASAARSRGVTCVWPT